MERKNGVSEFFGKLMSCKSGSSAHSTQPCTTNKSETKITRPYMSEACGGCDDHDAEIFGKRMYRVVVGG